MSKKKKAKLSKAARRAIEQQTVIFLSSVQQQAMIAMGMSSMRLDGLLSALQKQIEQATPEELAEARERLFDSCVNALNKVPEEKPSDASAPNST
jgi:hypothetical protein